MKKSGRRKRRRSKKEEGLRSITWANRESVYGIRKRDRRKVGDGK